jgi:exonuclease SbcD
MRILHTSDWHVGKVLKSRDRYDEHVAVLGSIVRAAWDEDADLVLPVLFLRLPRTQQQPRT